MPHFYFIIHGVLYISRSPQSMARTYSDDDGKLFLYCKNENYYKLGTEQEIDEICCITIT